MTQKLTKMEKVAESISISRYDNGWMIEISGRNRAGDYKSSKIICNTEPELLDLVKEYNTKELDN